MPAQVGDASPQTPSPLLRCRKGESKKWVEKENLKNETLSEFTAKTNENHQKAVDLPINSGSIRQHVNGKPSMNSTQNQLTKKLLLARRKQKDINEGFTLVELMVVIVIVGILSAVALPNFLNQTKKAAATEAKQQVSSIFKQAHTYVLENGALGDLSTNCSAYAGTLTTISEGAGYSYTCGGNQSAFTVTATGDTSNTNTKGVTVTLTGNCDKGTVASITTTGV